MHQTGRRLTRRGSGRSVLFTPCLYKPYPYEGPGESNKKAGEESSRLRPRAGPEMMPMKDSAPPPIYHNHHTSKNRLGEG